MYYQNLPVWHIKISIIMIASSFLFRFSMFDCRFKPANMTIICKLTLSPQSQKADQDDNAMLAIMGPVSMFNHHCALFRFIPLTSSERHDFLTFSELKHWSLNKIPSFCRRILSVDFSDRKCWSAYHNFNAVVVIIEVIVILVVFVFLTKH